MTKIIENFPDYTITTDGVITKIGSNYTLSQWIGKNGYKHVDLRKNGKGVKVAVHRLLATTFIPNPDQKRTVNHLDGDKLNNTITNLEWATDSENVQHAYDTGLQPYRRNYSLEEYDSMLNTRFLNGESLTSISKTENQSLTQLSYHLRESAERQGKLVEYETQIKLQKLKRAKDTGNTQRKLITLNMVDPLTGETINVFSSISEAQQFLNRKSSGPISNVLAGRQKSAYGYFWEKV